MKRFVLSIFAVACGSSEATPAADAGADADAPVPLLPAPELGQTHTMNGVDVVEIAVASNGLVAPRDLAFNPMRPDELWVVNNGDDSVVIVQGASTDGRTTERRKDGYALHFMPNPSSIAFGANETSAAVGKPGTFATCQESRNTFEGMMSPDNFMGVTLWSSDLTIFAKQNPIGLGSHLDMLHESPNCMGVAHEGANVYWVFGGYKKDIVRYDFVADHGIGQDYHADGLARHFLTGEVLSVSGVPSHLVYDAATSRLYVADTGHQRVIALDTTSGTVGSKLTYNQEPLKENVKMEGATFTEIVPPGLLHSPSGLELHKGILYVSDNVTARITAFSLEGKQLNYIDTGLPEGSLMGMAFGMDGKLYLVDSTMNRVLRLDPKSTQ